MMWMALLRELPRQMRQFHSFNRDGHRSRMPGSHVRRGRRRKYRQRDLPDWHGAWACACWASISIRAIPKSNLPRSTIALPQADVVVCAMDFNASNRGYFNAARLRTIKPGAVFVNISRGELSPSTALARCTAIRPTRRRGARRLRPRTGARRGCCAAARRRTIPKCGRRWNWRKWKMSSARPTTPSIPTKRSSARASTRSAKSWRFSKRANSNGRCRSR